MLRDLKYALRQLRKSLGFALTAVLTLTLGIGVTTTIFTLVYNVMLRPLPFAHANRLVTINEHVSAWSNMYRDLPVNANHFVFWQRHSRSFESICLMREYTAPLGETRHPQEVQVLSATPGIFSVLEVQPFLGRAFTEAEAQPGHEKVVVLLYNVWHNRFGADSSIIGRTLQLNGYPYTVLGVMPASFRLPPVDDAGSMNSEEQVSVGVLIPLAFTKNQLAEDMGDFNYFGLARLKPSISVSAAQAELNAEQHTISAELAVDENATLSASLTPWQQELVGGNRRPLLLLLAAVTGLLLVGCVNIANLLLARSVGQSQQMAIAAAMGASRVVMLRMALRETAVLAAIGGGLSILFAAVLVPAMQHWLPPALNFRGSLHLDWIACGCALLLALLSTLLAGAAPVWMASRKMPQEVLRSEAHLASESRGSKNVRRVLVSAEVAVSVAMVLMTTLVTASVVKLLTVDCGFTVERTIAAEVALPAGAYQKTQARSDFYRNVLAKVKSMPGVEQAGITSLLPLGGDGWSDIAQLPGDPRPWTQLPSEQFRWISPGYPKTIHLGLIAGRYFAASDWGLNEALISVKTAKELWPGKDPIGQKFQLDGTTDEKPFTVVGVVGNARTVTLAKPDPMMIYVPYWFRADDGAGLVIRTHQNPSNMIDAIHRAVWSVDAGVAVPQVRLLSGVLADSVANRRFEMALLLLFTVSALLLTALGVYGVVTYSVVQRQREIALRLALGAQRANIYRLVLRDGLLPVLVGAGVGVVAALALARLLASVLFEVNPYNPATAAGAVIILLTVGTLACLLPAHRAARIEPIKALQ